MKFLSYLLGVKTLIIDADGLGKVLKALRTAHRNEENRMTKRIEVANPTDKGFGTTPFLFQFGCVGTTNILAYGYSVDAALEEAADKLVELGYFGHITPHDQELVCDCDDAFECDSHTYTEAGWLTSYEWTFIESPTNEMLQSIVRS